MNTRPSASVLSPGFPASALIQNRYNVRTFDAPMLLPRDGKGQGKTGGTPVTITSALISPAIAAEVPSDPSRTWTYLLVGLLVAPIVGAIVNLVVKRANGERRRSRLERDLKRADVLEKLIATQKALTAEERDTALLGELINEHEALARVIVEERVSDRGKGRWSRYHELVKQRGEMHAEIGREVDRPTVEYNAELIAQLFDELRAKDDAIARERRRRQGPQLVLEICFYVLGVVCAVYVLLVRDPSMGWQIVYYVVIAGAVPLILQSCRVLVRGWEEFG